MKKQGHHHPFSSDLTDEAAMCYDIADRCLSDPATARKKRLLVNDKSQGREK